MSHASAIQLRALANIVDMLADILPEHVQAFTAAHGHHTSAINLDENFEHDIPARAALLNTIAERCDVIVKETESVGFYRHLSVDLLTAAAHVQIIAHIPALYDADHNPIALDADGARVAFTGRKWRDRLPEGWRWATVLDKEPAAVTP